MLDVMRQMWKKLGGLAGPIKSGSSWPSVFHITHHKAGSQWINRIFHALAYDHLVLPEVAMKQFHGQPIRVGMIYPTLYITREQFEAAPLPSRHERFVIIRDLRDALVSFYFSLKHSHPLIDARTEEARNSLRGMGIEEGLLYVMDTRVPEMAQVQWSWASAGAELIHYEDLLKDDVSILTRVLLDQCRLPISKERLKEVVLANRFEARSGRKPGVEDALSHERKGIAGDWRNYFTPKVTELFKRRYSSLLVATGYETGFNW